MEFLAKKTMRKNEANRRITEALGVSWKRREANGSAKSIN